MSDQRDQFAEHLKFFGELGVTGYRRDAAWSARSDSTADTDARSADARSADARSADARSADLQFGLDSVAQLAAIREDIGDCVRCKLCTLGRKQIVFGVGNPNADLMFVGEAPGRDEDIQGIPFVGRAGQKLTQIIEAIGLTRDDVYIAK